MQFEHWDETTDGEMDESAMRRKLEAGDCLRVPKGVIHSAEAVGDQAVISIDAVKMGI